MIKTPNFVLFVSFMVKTFFLTWLRLCGAKSFVVKEFSIHASQPTRLFFSRTKLHVGDKVS